MVLSFYRVQAAVRFGHPRGHVGDTPIGYRDFYTAYSLHAVSRTGATGTTDRYFTYVRRKPHSLLVKLALQLHSMQQVLDT